MRRTLAAVLVVCLSNPCSVQSLRGQDSEQWRDAVDEVLNRQEYRHSHWGILVCDLETGIVVFEQNADKLFAPASVTKLFSVAAAWEAFGPEHRFTTPVYRRGEVDGDGRLDGDLILVASGDLTLGGRTNAEGGISFRNSDHTYANGNSTAQITDEDPLAGLNELARQVRESGIRLVAGEVLIDSRLFETAASTGSGPNRVTPIAINDNLVDVVVTPAAEGERASVSWRPQSAVLEVDSLVETSARDSRPDLRVSWVGPGRIVIRGSVPASHAPVVRVVEWMDAEFMARAFLIEALRRAGVQVDASPLSAPREAALPDREWYAVAPRVASLESPPFAENAKLILKVSHNLHASTLPLLVATARGKRSLAEGLRLQGDLLEQFGVDRGTISFGGGAGGDRADFVTPRATVQLLRAMSTRDDFERFRAALPVLGVDGTLSTVVTPESPAKGKVFAKTGTLYWDNALNGQTLLTSKALAGYIEAASGRRLAFAIFVNLAHLPSPEETSREGKALGRLAEILQQSL
jgi:D-alanyl-D-alanine carboxypeptidase/D-alanyl-D-alanine-endopeptidase (penicillin-binding protein 4)